MNRDIVDRDLNAWAERAPGLDLSGRHVIWRIQIASRYIEQAYAALDGSDSQLSSSGAKLLIYLSTLPAPHQITPKDMSELLSLTSGTVTSLIDRLESFGYVERHRDPDDRRGVLVRLTPEGLSTAARLRAAYAGFETALLASLDEQERATLVILLRKLLSGFESGPTEFGKSAP